MLYVVTDGQTRAGVTRFTPESGSPRAVRAETELADAERLLTCVAGGKSLVRRASESRGTCH